MLNIILNHKYRKAIKVIKDEIRDLRIAESYCMEILDRRDLPCDMARREMDFLNSYRRERETLERILGKIK